MQTAKLAWTWGGQPLSLGIDTAGEGPTVLLLPALSSISTRREMRPLQERLRARYRTIAADWPGFGDEPRPPVAWAPAAYAAFLRFLIEEFAPNAHAVVAAGHGATYALAHAAAHPGRFGRLVLLAPTWRGPLPTMMKGRRPWFDRLCRMVDVPLLGPLIYRLNVNRPVVRLMVAGHVYAQPALLQGERLREKLAVTRAPGARFSSIRFVAGALDPLGTREQFLDLARAARLPMLVVYGAQTPPRSRGEMEALAALPGMRVARLPMGKLSLHEEFPDEVAQAIAPFLAEGGRTAA